MSGTCTPSRAVAYVRLHTRSEEGGGSEGGPRGQVASRMVFEAEDKCEAGDFDVDSISDMSYEYGVGGVIGEESWKWNIDESYCRLGAGEMAQHAQKRERYEMSTSSRVEHPR